MDESVKISGDLMGKIRKLAEQEGRTIKGQIERIIQAALKR